jgi:hypothetical protein
VLPPLPVLASEVSVLFIGDCGCELVDLGGQDEIAFCQAVDLVGPGRNLDFSPGKEDVRVVSLHFSELAYLVDKLERFPKVGKREGLREVVFLHGVPADYLLLQ